MEADETTIDIEPGDAIDIESGDVEAGIDIEPGDVEAGIDIEPGMWKPVLT